MATTLTPIANVPGSSQTAGTLQPQHVILVNANGDTQSEWTPYSYIAAGSANQDSTVVKNTAGVLGYVLLGNSQTTIRYVKIYDKATAPTSADTPKMRFLVPGSSAGGGSNAPVYIGSAFANGIAFRITTGLPDSDTGLCALNDAIVNLGYV